MNKKLALFLLLTALLLPLLAQNSYPIRYSLTGFYPLTDNKIDIMKFTPGLSISERKCNIIRNFKFNTREVVDIEDSLVVMVAEYHGIEFPRQIIVTFDQYIENQFVASFHKELRKKAKERIEEGDRDVGEGIFGKELSIDLPKMALPKVVKDFMGDKAARLNIDGSEKLTFRIGSTKNSGLGNSESGSQEDLDLDLKQELRLRLRGTIGEKIHVNITHTSVSDEEVGNPNTIEIKYIGNEDEIVQTIEAGNISLSLSGSQISYSASSESLFGIKSTLKAGPVDMTYILGKEEGEKNTETYIGESQEDSLTIYSQNFAKYKYFCIENPVDLYAIYGFDSPLPENYPSSWVNNAVVTGDGGAWMIKMPELLPDASSLRVFLDDNNYSNNAIETVAGQGINDPDGTTYNFEELFERSDYTFDYDTGILSIDRSMLKSYTIGVTYTTNNGQNQIGDPNGSPILVKLLYISNQTMDSPTWDYQMRNIYSLNMQNAKTDGFKVNVYTELNNDMVFSVPDSIDMGSVGTTYNDYLRLDSNGDALINGDDNTINLGSGFIIFPFIEPFRSLDNVEIYSDGGTIYNTDTTMRMYVIGKVGRDQISLNQINIVKGSVSVKVNGRTIEENVDYTVDYDFGTITFLTQEAKDPTAEIEIDYEYRPLFAISSRFITGLRANWKIGDNFRLGGTFIYHSEEVEDKRPKIGSENKIQMMGGLDGELKFEMPFLTRLVDWIPLIKTDTESEVSLSGEVAVNIPQIYGDPDKKNDPEAYLEDMESILNTFPLGTTRATWVPGSEPLHYNFGKAEINWYNPTDIYMNDVYNDDLLTDKEKNEKVSLMQVRVLTPGIHTPGVNRKYWAGLQKYIGNQLDFSDKKYIEIMVKADSVDSPINIHIDLGDVSEDFYTKFGGEGVLNTEDGKNGGDLDGVYDYVEDIGLDGYPNGNPLDDPDDNFSNDKVNNIYPYINGTEDNNSLDTEDLDLNGNLDTTNRYLEYSISLDSDQYLESENEKGYRIYRIPLKTEGSHQSFSDSATQPELDRVSYIRIWFETEEDAIINIVSMEVVGNKWEESTMRYSGTDEIVPVSYLESHDVSVQAGIIDNQKDNTYTSPDGTTEEKDGVEVFEQALTVDYQNIHSGTYSLVHQKLTNTFNLLNYGKLRFWVYPEMADYGTVSDSIEIVLQLGADSLNFYEVSVRMEPNEKRAKMVREWWKDIEINFNELTRLKLINSDNSSIVSDTTGIYTYRKYQNPSLSSIKYLSLGIRVPGGEEKFNGRVFFDDIRVADPFDDWGYSASSSLSIKFADFSNLNVNLSWETPNFYLIRNRTGSTGTTNTAFDKTISLDITNNYSLHKFFPAEWGLSIPLSLKQNQSESRSKYIYNSDVEVSTITDEAEKERQITRTLKRSASISFSQNKTPDSWILAYTLKNFSFTGDISKNISKTPAVRDTTLAYNQKYAYNLDIPREKLGFEIFHDYSVYILPRSYKNSLNYRISFPRRWRWQLNSDGNYGWNLDTQTQSTKTIDTSNIITYDLTSDLSLTYTLTTQRNMLWRDEWQSVNIGRTKDKTQSFDLSYDPHYIDNILSFSSSMNIDYNENQREYNNTTDPDLPEHYFKFEGSVQRKIDFDVTLRNSDLLTGLADWLGAPPDELQEMEEALPEDDKTNRDKEEESDFDPDKIDDLGHGDGEEVLVDETVEVNLPEEDKKIYNELDDDEIMKRIAMQDTTLTETTAVEPKQPITAAGILAVMVRYLARFENISVKYTNTYGTTYDDRDKPPNFNYQLSLPHVLSENIEDEEISSKSLKDEVTISTAFQILNNLDTRWTYSKMISKTFTSATRKTEKTVFPNVTVTLTQIENILGISDYLSNSRISSSYSFSRQDEWSSGRLQTVTKSYSMRPLAEWAGKWSANLNTRIGYSMDRSEINNITSNFINETNGSTLSASLSHTLKAAKGIKIPFVKERLRLKNEFTTDITFSWDKNKSIRKGNDETQTSSDTEGYDATLGGSYNFHRNVNGGSTIDYAWTHDKKNNNTVRTFGVSLWVEIIF